MANNKFGAKEVLDCTLYDMATGKPVIVFDTLKTSEIAVTTEKVYARGGKGNSKLLTWEINKDAKLTISDALLSPKSMELLSGVATKIGTQTITMRQKTEWDTTGASPIDKGDLYPLTATSGGAISLAFVPKEAAANILVYEATDDCGTPLAMTSATLSDKTLTVPAAASKKVIVYYTYTSASTAETYVIDSTHFASAYKLVGDTVVKNSATGKDEAFQITIPNLQWSSALTLSFSADGDPSVQTFDCEIQRSASSSTMIQMVKY
jgi:formylmethanofuran dehydrogenase subunit D